MNARALLKRWNLKPAKALGQNFLSDPNILHKITAAAGLTSDDVVLEIGAGLGILTARLARNAGHVIAVELDQRLLPVLRSVVAGFENVTLIQGDILALDLDTLIDDEGKQYKVVGNLPYYISTAVIRHVVEARQKPQRMVITVQREVAERIVAGPGQMSLLAVSVQFYGRPQILFHIKPGSFFPAPGVQSTVLRVDLYASSRFSVDPSTFFRVARAGFSQRRKQLRNALAAGLGRSPGEIAARLREAGVDPRRRAQALGLEDWAKIARMVGGVDAG